MNIPTDSSSVDISFIKLKVDISKNIDEIKFNNWVVAFGLSPDAQRTILWWDHQAWLKNNILDIIYLIYEICMVRI